MELVNLKAFSRWDGRLGNATISAVHATSVNKRMDFIIYPLGPGTFIIGLFCCNRILFVENTIDKGKN